jgi:hypothetical protein
MQDKVKVGVTSATGYGVTLAAVLAAALDYIGGDHSQPTRTTLILGIVAGVSFVTTQVGRYVQAHAQLKRPALTSEQYDTIAQHVHDTVDGMMAEEDEPPEEPSWLHDEKANNEKVAADKPYTRVWGLDETPHDLVDEPEDDESDRVPEHEQRDLHDGGLC